MTLTEAIESRFSCRAYTDEPLDQSTIEQLSARACKLSEGHPFRFVIVGPDDGGAQLKLGERMFASQVSTYAALIGPDDNLVREQIGYFGEKLVLEITQMGLGTCWVAGTFDRSSVTIPLAEGELLHDVIPIGHMPAKQPFAQRAIRAAIRKRDKKPEAMYEGPTKLAEAPSWIRAGIAAVIKGPSAVNEQPVVFVHDGGLLRATLPHLKRDLEFTDLGIAKLHFEIAAADAGMPGSWEWGAPGTYVLQEG